MVLPALCQELSCSPCVRHMRHGPSGHNRPPVGLPPLRASFVAPDPDPGPRATGAACIRRPRTGAGVPSPVFARAGRDDGWSLSVPARGRWHGASRGGGRLQSSCLLLGSGAGSPPILPRAFRARAGAPVGAGAVRAPDCARETADARLPPVSQGLFRAGAKREAKRSADAACSCLILAQFLRDQALQENYFQIKNKWRFRP